MNRLPNAPFARSLTSLPNRLKFDLFRHGTDYYNKHYLTYIPTEELTWAHSLFCCDGSGLISYRYTERVRDRKTGIYREQTRTRNLYVVMVTDVASGYVAGYGIAPEGSSEESFAIVQDAVRMAVDAGGRQTMFESCRTMPLPSRAARAGNGWPMYSTGCGRTSRANSAGESG